MYHISHHYERLIVGVGPAPRGQDPEKPVRLPGSSELPDGQPVVFADCAGVLRTQGDVKGAARLEKAGTQWMRHSLASHAIARGTPIEIAQQNLGHASLATTTVCVTTECRRRMKAVAGFWQATKP